MKISRVGSRGYLFSFDDLQDTEFGVTTNVYIINSKKTVYICDTFLGPDCMEEVVSFIKETLGNKKIIVFNSHSDWDHIWGNCFFASGQIISHIKCHGLIKENGLKELEKYKQYQRGAVNVTLPGILFEDRLEFTEDNLTFFHTPGHTSDSSSCYDALDKVLFAGDNLEYPNPYQQGGDPKVYLETLQNYLKLDIIRVVPGHGEITDKKIIEDNIHFLKYFIKTDNN